MATAVDLSHLPVVGGVSVSSGSSDANKVVITNTNGVIDASFLNNIASYQGTWNASTNTPTLTSSVGTKGHYYIVSTAGSTSLNGISTWLPGDWAAFNGSVWQRITGISPLVVSVAGRIGTVTLTSADLTDATTLGKALATTASQAAARTSLGLGTLAVLSPSGTASSSTFLRGDNSWSAPPTGSVTTVASGALSPLFTVTVNNPTTTPQHKMLFWPDPHPVPEPPHIVPLSRQTYPPSIKIQPAQPLE